MKLKAHTLKALVCVMTGALVTSGWAQTATKPAASTTKVKKVLLYNKIGGWRHSAGIADVKTVMTRLAASKGFQLVQSEDESALTAANLATFQAIVWNNNTNGAGSVSDAGARTAVMNYLKQGGGWLLIHGAGDHANSWADLTTTLGNSFTRHGNQGPAEFVIDNAAKSHKELKFMVQDLPTNGVVRLTDEWYSFQRTVRPLSGVTVVATARAAGTNGVIVPVEDGSGDLTYIWARDVEKGRLLYNAIGHGENQLMAQVDSVVTKFYWDNLRYVAGDFQNGCTTVGNANYDATARVHDQAMCSATSIIGGEKAFRSDLAVSYSGLKAQVSFPHSEAIVAKMRDLRGAVVWERTFAQGAAEIAVGGGLNAGLYQLELRSGKSVANQRIVLR